MRRVSTRRTVPTLRRSVVRAFVALLAGMASAAVTSADQWPTRPIKLIVPGAPGSTSDLVSRVIANELALRLQQPVVIMDKPGAGGTIAMAEAARATPDGYTVAFATQGSLVFGQALYATPGFDSLTDLAPVAFVGGVANVLVVNTASPAVRVQDIVAAAKRQPGFLTYSSGGNGSSHHLCAVLFAQLTGTELVHVAYRAPAPAVQAVIAGEVTMGFFNIPTVIAQIRNGQIKALGVTSLKRSPLLPDVPTLDEQGLRGYEVSTWFGIVAPRATPPEIVVRLNTEINHVLSLPHVRDRWEAEGYDVASPMPPTKFSQIIRDELTRWVPIVRASGATPN